MCHISSLGCFSFMRTFPMESLLLFTVTETIPKIAAQQRLSLLWFPKVKEVCFLEYPSSNAMQVMSRLHARRSGSWRINIYTISIKRGSAELLYLAEACISNSWVSLYIIKTRSQICSLNLHRSIFRSWSERTVSNISFSYCTFGTFAHSLNYCTPIVAWRQKCACP